MSSCCLFFLAVRGHDFIKSQGLPSHSCLTFMRFFPPSSLIHQAEWPPLTTPLSVLGKCSFYEARLNMRLNGILLLWSKIFLLVADRIMDSKKDHIDISTQVLRTGKCSTHVMFEIKPTVGLKYIYGWIYELLETGHTSVFLGEILPKMWLRIADIDFSIWLYP